MTVANDLATLRWWVSTLGPRPKDDEVLAALACVEDEIARLQERDRLLTLHERQQRERAVTGQPVSDALATLHLIPRLENAEEYDAALACVKDEIARLEDADAAIQAAEASVRKHERHIDTLFARAEAAEAEIARLEQELRDNDRLVESAWAVRDRETEKAQTAEAEVARLKGGLRTFAAELHVPPDGIGPDSMTAHRHTPGHPMGCPICKALDEALADDGHWRN